MADFLIAIPTYNRVDKQITLNTMLKYGIPKERIYLFTQTAEDYTACLARYSVYCNVMFMQAKNVAQARNNILQTLVPNNDVLMCDDDISSFGKLDKDGKIHAIKRGEEFEQEISTCYAFTKKHGSKLFGLYPVYNDFFMSHTISTKVLINTVHGIAKGFPHKMQSALKAKEDIEMCARMLAKGEDIVRFNYLAANALHRSNKGGCKEIWASQENAKVSAILEKTYPSVLKVKPNNKNEVSVVLKDVKIKEEEAYGN